MECVAAFPPYTYLPHDLLPSVWEPRVLPEGVSVGRPELLGRTHRLGFRDTQSAPAGLRLLS